MQRLEASAEYASNKPRESNTYCSCLGWFIRISNGRDLVPCCCCRAWRFSRHPDGNSKPFYPRRAGRTHSTAGSVLVTYGNSLTSKESPSINTKSTSRIWIANVAGRDSRPREYSSISMGYRFHADRLQPFAGFQVVAFAGVRPLNNLTVILRYSEESASIDIAARFFGVPQNDNGGFSNVPLSN